jgi:hypothetical protein
VQQPRLPFAIAATGPRGMRLAARYGQVWVTTGERTAQRSIGAARGATMVREQILRLEETCAQVGRDPATLPRLVLAGAVLDSGLTSLDAFRDTTGRYAEAGVTDFVVHWPRPNQPYNTDLATFERIVSDCTGAPLCTPAPLE